jgi:putative lipase involved disintegration of autophagic bodies
MQNCHGSIRRKFYKNNSTSIMLCTGKMYVIVENCQEKNINRNERYFLFNYAEG